MKPIRSLFLALGAVALVAAGCSSGDDTTRDDAGNVIEGGELSVFSMNVGDCFLDLPGSSEVESVEAVPCADEHVFEVYHLFDVDLDEFDETAVGEQAAEGCLAEFEDYMGVEYAVSFYDIRTLTPSEGSWGQDDREVVCMVTPFEGGTTQGTARGANLLLEGAESSATTVAPADDTEETTETTETTEAAADDDTTTETTTEPADTETASVFDLEVGQCFMEATQGLTSSIEQIDCDEPHGAEVYFLFDIDLPEYDATEVETLAGDGCYEAFPEYHGISYEESWYDFTWYEPSAESWSNGDREVVCLTVPYEGDSSTGSAFGTARELGADA